MWFFYDKFRKISKRDLKPESVDGARIYISSCIKYRIYNLVWHRALFASHITSFRAINIRLDFPSISLTKKSVQIFLDEKPRPKTVNVAKFFFPLGHNIYMTAADQSFHIFFSRGKRAFYSYY